MHLFLAGAFVIYAFLVGVELQVRVSIEIGEEGSRDPVLTSDDDYDEKPQFGPFLGVCTAWTPTPEPAEVLLLPSPGGELIHAPLREIQERPGFPLALLIPACSPSRLSGPPAGREPRGPAVPEGPPSGELALQSPALPGSGRGLEVDRRYQVPDQDDAQRHR